MARALISVSQDGFTYLTLNGATSRYSDTGQAMTYLGDYARETATQVPVTIDDGNQEVDVVLDETGKIAPAASASPTPPPAQEPSSSPAAPASDGNRSTDESTTTSATDGDPADAQSERHQQGKTDAEAGNGDDYPLGTPFSGPAAPNAPTVKRTRVRKRAPQHKNSPQNRPQRLKKITVPGLVLIGIVILMIGAFVIPNIVPAGSQDSPQTIESEQQINPASELSVDKTEDVVPGFDNSPTWETKIPKDASVTASDRGVLVVDGGKLEVLDSATGKTRYSG
ncbi:MAG: hypothetical protein L0H22_08870, partial [Brevibacterium aurantiacum]|nr:hypothetical protein [Brevibacterium aurantiacum]